ncbi:MAG TPA: FlgD immunoglobulin-like domain containing protein [Candidatus Saccharimonadales bacterium]|nr:FlgD immunoglobulin-like domain containing protein [Candidatus Saccharimonadales bacterium]
MNKTLKLLFLLPVLAGALAPAAHASFTGTIYLTNFSTHQVSSASVVGGLVSGAPSTITGLAGSDGIVCTPGKTELIIGGQLSDNIYKVDPVSGTSTQLNNNTPDALLGAFHVTFNPAGTQVWTGAFYSADIGWVDYATGATHSSPVTGTDNGIVTGVVFMPNGDFYVSDAPDEGGGSVYLLNTSTFAATKVFTSAKTSHGLTYDPYTKHLLVDGADEIDEIAVSGANPATLVRSWSVAGMIGTDFLSHLDQGFSDGVGNYFVGSNEGTLIYLDLTAASPAPVVSGHLGSGLDDVTGCFSAPPPPPCKNKPVCLQIWQWQCGRCTHQASADSINALFAEITAGGSKVFGKGGCYIASCALLTARCDRDLRTQAAQQYLALLLNEAAGLICDTAKVHCGGTCGSPGTTVRVSDVIALIDSSLCKQNKPWSFYQNLASLAECVNNSGQTYGKYTTHWTDTQAAASQVEFQVELLSGNPLRLNSGAGVSFRLSAPGVSIVNFGIFDAAGRLVAQPLRYRAVAGPTVVNWDGRTLQGARGAAGAYFYRVTAGTQVRTGRFIVVE